MGSFPILPFVHDDVDEVNGNGMAKEAEAEKYGDLHSKEVDMRSVTNVASRLQNGK